MRPEAEPTSIRLTPADRELIAKLADRLGARTTSEVVRRLVNTAAQAHGLLPKTRPIKF